MTHKEALQQVDSILNQGNTTWQGKKDLLADLLVEVSRPTPLYHDTDSDFDFENE